MQLELQPVGGDAISLIELQKNSKQARELVRAKGFRSLIACAVVIEAAGFADDYFHSLGHFVGLYVHDAGLQREPLKAGMVITIEPGIYLAREAIGIRIEDDILVTEDGCEVLSASIPREISEVEAWMAGRDA